MTNLFDFNKLSTWLLWLLIVYVLIMLYRKSNGVEHFIPWNMGTRFYPSYDIRGYPYLYPWNYPYPSLPYLYSSPYFYEANGKYIFDPKYAKLLSYAHTRVLRT